MKIYFTTLVLSVALFLQACSGVSDDGFAHAIKRGDHAETMRMMQPHHGKLQVQEVNGKWYNPLQYSIASGDKEASFALLERGAPQSFDGRSLAYNAARIGRGELARSFANAGYGTSNDVYSAEAERAAVAERNRQQSEQAMAMGIMFIAALMGGSGSNSYDGDLCSCGRPATVNGRCTACARIALGPPY